MNPQHHLYNIDEYFDINTDLITYKKQILPLESNKKKYYITLKIYYNYLKIILLIIIEFILKSTMLSLRLTMSSLRVPILSAHQVV